MDFYRNLIYSRAMNDEHWMMTVREVADLHKCSMEVVQEACRNRDLPCTWTQFKRWIKTEDAKAWSPSATLIKKLRPVEVAALKGCPVHVVYAACRNGTLRASGGGGQHRFIVEADAIAWTPL